MDDQSPKINSQDLYAPTPEESPSVAVEPEPLPAPDVPKQAESTEPVFEPERELPDPLSRPELPPSSHQRSNPLGMIVLFLVLFFVGIGASLLIRQLLSVGFPSFPVAQTTPSPVVNPTGIPNDPFAGWLTYEVISGVTRDAVPGVSFRLPEEVYSPLCDGASCASQGTYLSGGTRFTVAVRGPRELLKDFRGAKVSDVSGKLFTSKDATVSGRPAVEFTGTFVGTTVGGYSFSQMHGYMVAVSDTLSLEINHFTPTGITADFDGDDTLFEKIITTFSFSETTPVKPSISTPTPTLFDEEYPASPSGQ